MGFLEANWLNCIQAVNISQVKFSVIFPTILLARNMKTFKINKSS